MLEEDWHVRTRITLGKQGWCPPNPYPILVIFQVAHILIQLGTHVKITEFDITPMKGIIGTRFGISDADQADRSISSG